MSAIGADHRFLRLSGQLSARGWRPNSGAVANAIAHSELCLNDLRLLTSMPKTRHTVSLELNRSQRLSVLQVRSAHRRRRRMLKQLRVLAIQDEYESFSQATAFSEGTQLCGVEFQVTLGLTSHDSFHRFGGAH